MQEISLIEDWELAIIREGKYYNCETCYRNPVMYKIGWRHVCYECALNEYSGHSFFCPICGALFDNKHYHSTDNELLCTTCKNKYKREYASVNNQNNRTGAKGLIHDLKLVEWIEIVKSYNYKCKYCGGDYTDMDHVIPVSKGGGTTKSNVVPCCRICNLSKGNAT